MVAWTAFQSSCDAPCRMHRTSHQYMAIHMHPLHRNVSVCMRVRMRVRYSRVLPTAVSISKRTIANSCQYRRASPILDGSTLCKCACSLSNSWTTVPPRTNLTLVPFNGLTSGKSGWCTWNTSRFARPWRNTYPIPHDTPCDRSQNPVCSSRGELPPYRALHLCERIQYIGPNGPCEHHLEGLRFRFSFMVTWPSTAFASGLYGSFPVSNCQRIHSGEDQEKGLKRDSIFLFCSPGVFW